MASFASIKLIWRRLCDQFEFILRRLPRIGRGLPGFVIVLITGLLMALHFFISLPSLNPRGPEFYAFISLALLIYWGLRLIFGKTQFSSKAMAASLLAFFLCWLIPLAGNFFAAPFFHAKAYASLITVQDGTFAADIDQVQLSQVPIVDREAAGVIGEKQMGSMGKLVSQFEIDDNYAQINIAGRPVRVSPLKYYDLIKYVTNFKNGIEYYVSVDMTTQDGNMNHLAEPIFYSKSDYLMRNIDRHVRFRYPFELLGETNFEIDDDGKAWYVTQVMTRRIAFFGGEDAKGVILTDAHNGATTFYAADVVPSWVDRVHHSDMVIRQLDRRGMLSNGYWNSVIGQKNVVRTTDGYNYISMGTDIYLITGVTSVRSDTSNLGFYYVNLRTKESKFYQVPSVTETAAMASAKGKVQEKNYKPTFPVILNINERPVYFMSLKDNSLTAKMFALVDAEQFTDVVVGNTVRECFQLYYADKPVNSKAEVVGELKTYTLKEIRTLVMEGRSLFFFTTEETPEIFQADPTLLGPQLAFLKGGDHVELRATSNGDILRVSELKKK